MPHDIMVPIEARIAPAPILTREELFSRAIVWLDEHPNRRFSVFQNMERMKRAKLLRTPTTSTALEPLATVLRESGIRVGPTVGDLLNAAPYLTTRNLHDAVCECLGACATSENIARRMRPVSVAR